MPTNDIEGDLPTPLIHIDTAELLSEMFAGFDEVGTVGGVVALAVVFVHVSAHYVVGVEDMEHSRWS